MISQCEYPLALSVAHPKVTRCGEQVSSPAPKAGSWQAQLHDVIAVRVLAIFRQAGQLSVLMPSPHASFCGVRYAL